MPARIDSPFRPIVPTKPPELLPSTIREAEKLLQRSGYGVGTRDGKSSPALEKAVREFQAAWSLPVTGSADPRTMAKLRTTAKRASTDVFSVGQRSNGIQT